MLCWVLAVLTALPTPQEAPAPASPALPSSGPAAGWQLDEATHRALDAAAGRGLQWLAERQLPTGAFVGVVGHKQGDGYHELDIARSVPDQRREGAGHLGVAALCGMAFLAGGHLPDRGPHQATVQRTVDYILAHGRENGFLTDSGTRMYSHAFATLFLAEAYGMAGRGRGPARPGEGFQGDAVKLALERAVHLIVDCQNVHGGWRYNPFDRELDLSVTVCQVQALRAARNIGIQVPHETIERAVAYVQASRTPRGRDRGLYYYKIHGRGAFDKNREFAINAAAVTCLHSAGIYDPEQTDPALEFLLKEYGPIADYYGQHYYFWYGNYYACQALFQAGGDRFRTYYAALSRDLLAMQREDGSWPNRVGPGDEFSTAVACLLLQLPKQYLPIFQR